MHNNLKIGPNEKLPRTLKITRTVNFALSITLTEANKGELDFGCITLAAGFVMQWNMFERLMLFTNGAPS